MVVRVGPGAGFLRPIQEGRHERDVIRGDHKILSGVTVTLATQGIEFVDVMRAPERPCASPRRTGTTGPVTLGISWSVCGWSRMVRGESDSPSLGGDADGGVGDLDVVSQRSGAGMTFGGQPHLGRLSLRSGDSSGDAELLAGLDVER